MRVASGNTVEETNFLTAICNGDAVATEKFVRDNAAWMLTVARRILQDNTHTEDVVQDAFVNIFKGLKSFNGKSAVKTWMHRIVINQALMELRRRKRANETSIDDLLPEFDENSCRIEDNLANYETPETQLQKSETRKKTAELIVLLPDNYRIVLVLRDIEDLSTAETAEILGLSETNVKVRLHRARSALKKLLEPLVREQAL